MRLRLTLEYDGTGFRGWAAQPGLRTVEGVLQEALADLYDAWSYRVLVRVCSDARRSARRSVPSIDLTGIESPLVDSQSMVATRDELERAFATLSLNQRTVLVLMYYEDLTVAEIAASLGISVGTVKSRLHGARNALRAAIDADSRLQVRAERPA